MIEDAARLAYDVAKLNLDPLKMGIDPRAAFALECGEQPIPRRDNFSVPSHVLPQNSSQPAKGATRAKLQFEWRYDVTTCDKCKFRFILCVIGDRQHRYLVLYAIVHTLSFVVILIGGPNDMHQGILSKRVLASNLGNEQNPRQDYGSADVRQSGQTMRAESKKDNRKLIVETAERLFQQIGFQKTTVADIARDVAGQRLSLFRGEIGNQRGCLHGPPWQDRGGGEKNCGVPQQRYAKNTQLDRVGRKDPPQTIYVRP